MSKRGPESFMKRQRELKRMRKAQAKRERRHGKKQVNKSEIELWLERNRKVKSDDKQTDS